MTRILALLAFILPGFGAFADWSPLVEPDTALRVIEAEAPVVVDIRSPSAYAKGHVEGAVNIPYNAWRGPEGNAGALISPEKLTLLLGEAGVERDVPVLVTYEGAGTLDFGSAARVYWTLKSAGVENIAILNGGVRAWVASGQPLSTEEGANFPSDATFDFDATLAIARDGIADVLNGVRRAVTVDARPVAFFEGRERHPDAVVAGTLPGALSLVHEDWFDGGRLAVTPETARARLAAAGIDGSVPIVNFCNTGHWAATNWFVMSEIAGLPNVTLYPESWVGWTRALIEVAAR